MFSIQDFIRAKRDGETLSPDAIAAYVAGVTDGTIADAAVAAFCMSVLWRGMTAAETAALTRAMARSGTVLDWDIAPVIDKHSTGGVGDKTSLMLAPIAAACGLFVPMIAGRGLGHTGGTIDKLDCIPGFRTDLKLPDFQRVVRMTGCAIIGQTAEFAPADKRIYAVRDVTATVESIPLITASILSKKLAAGLQGLVLDVKFGNGAFMQDMDDAQALADSLQSTAREAGLNLVPVLTDMNQVLGHAAGNAVEIQEAVDYLAGTRREARLHDVTMRLAMAMLRLGHAADSDWEAERKILQVLDSGAAAEKFDAMVAAQGGPKNFIADSKAHLPQAPVTVDVVADRDGTLTAMDTRGIGMVLVNMHAGRARVDDRIDPVIGVTDVAPLGTICVAGETVLARFHLRETLSSGIAAQSFLNCLDIA